MISLERGKNNLTENIFPLNSEDDIIFRPLRNGYGMELIIVKKGNFPIESNKKVFFTLISNNRDFNLNMEFEGIAINPTGKGTAYSLNSSTLSGKIMNKVNDWWNTVSAGGNAISLKFIQKARVHAARLTDFTVKVKWEIPEQN